MNRIVRIASHLAVAWIDRIVRIRMLSDLGIAKKVLLPVLLVFVIGLLLAGSAGLQMSGRLYEARDIVASGEVSLRRLEALEDRIATLSRFNYQLVVEPRRSLPEALRQYRQESAKTRELLATMREGGGIDRAQLDRLGAHIDSIRKVEERLIGFRRPRGLADAAAQAHIADRSFDAVHLLLRQMIAAEHRKIDATNAALESTFQRMFVLQAIFLLAAMTLVTLFSFQLVRRQLVEPLRALGGTMADLAEDRLDGDMPVTGRKDEIGAMADSLSVFRSRLRERRRFQLEVIEAKAETDKQLKQLEAALRASGRDQATVVAVVAHALDGIAAGDLSVRITEEIAPEYQALKHNFNAALARLEDAMHIIASGADGIASGAGQISAGAADLSRRTEEQTRSLVQTAAAINEITMVVGQNAEIAEKARSAVALAKSDASRSGAVIDQTRCAMDEVEVAAQSINRIVGIIQAIAGQTNLLAINATIEAARAGSSARGFAVVAAEVRALAHRSSEASKQIEALVCSTTTQVRQGAALVGTTGDSLKKIIMHVDDIENLIGGIAVSAQHQAGALLQINNAVRRMEDVTKDNARMVQESSEASCILSEQAKAQSSSIGRFRFTRDAPAKAA